MKIVTFPAHTDTALRTFVTDLLEESFAKMGVSEPLQRQHWESSLFQPALYMLLRPGKQFRSEVLKSCWELAGGHPEQHPQELAFLVELLHVGSLIIDDIEDDSATRRGQATLHRKYGVPVALNTGNWLYFLPLCILPRLGLPDAVTLAMYEDISAALLLSHQGQAIDLATHVNEIRQNDMCQIVTNSTRLKTGTLMRLAAQLGARAAGADPQRLEALGRLGADIGLGLQMLDDWSGVSTPERSHKGIEDLRHGRLTWPWAWLAETTDEVSFAALMHDTNQISIDWEAEQILLRIKSQLREHAPQQIREFLREAFAELEGMSLPGDALSKLRSTIDSLEKAYG